MPIKNTISATDITKCLRGVVYKKQGKERPKLHPEIKELLEMFRKLGKIGYQIQDKVVEFWRNKGSLIEADGWVPVEQYGFTGRFDAICKIQGKTVLYEIKGVSHSYYEWVAESKQARDYNKIQTMIYHQSMLGKYPDLEPRILYFSRKLFKQGQLKPIEIKIDYSEDDFRKIQKNSKQIHLAISGGEMPPHLPDIEIDQITGKKIVSFGAMTCEYHALCTGDGNWYEHAKEKVE
jgi:hypothetical protein